MTLKQCLGKAIHIGLLILFNMVFVGMVKAQDLTNVKKNKPLTIGGGINFSSSGYEVSGMPSRLDPFSWSVAANLNFNILGVFDLPFSFNYTQGNKSFGQPSFNQFGMSPKYKFVTVHAGYRSMQFSNYSLSGVMFLGGGVEIAPEKSLVKGSIMYGKFAKAVAFDTLQKEQYSNNLFGAPGYERWGYGGKVTVGRDARNVSVVMFRAWDKPGSIADPPVESGIKPKENLVIGLAATTPVTDRIKLIGEFTLSALTLDVRLPKRSMETFSYINNLGGIYTPRESSISNKAYSFGVGYRGDIWNWEANIKHVDPGYESLGTTYLTNDIEDYTLKLGRTFLQNKINVSTNGGIQRNNLANQLKVTNKRFIGGVDFSYSVNDKLSVTGNFSNFNASTAPSSVTIVDTFKYVQVTDNYSLVGNYNFGDNNLRHSLMSNVIYQTVNTLNRTADLVTENGTKLFNINTSHTISFVPVNFNFTTSLNYNKYVMDKIITQAYGPTFSASKSVFQKKIRLSTNYSLLNNVAANGTNNWMNMVKASANYKLGKAHNFQLSLSYLNKKIPARQNIPERAVNEFKGTFSYSFTFNK